MRKQITVTIDIDDESFGTTRMRGDTRDPSSFRVEIRNDIYRITSASNVLPISIAHELGHVIGQICGLPAALADPRFPKNPGMPGTPEYENGVLASEHEAWDVAEMIFSIRRARQDAIRGHEEAFRGPETWRPDTWMPTK